MVVYIFVRYVFIIALHPAFVKISATPLRLCLAMAVLWAL